MSERPNQHGPSQPARDAPATAPSAPNPSAEPLTPQQRIAKYDQAYTLKKDFLPQPNQFLSGCLDRIRCQGCALDIGTGQGRNAILLAQRGFQTTGIDRSSVGVAEAQQRGREMDLDLRIQIADANDYDFGVDRWDLIALFYYPALYDILTKVQAAIKPGGHLIIERYSQNRDAPESDDSGPNRNRLLRHFLSWDILHYEHDVFESDWHWGEDDRSGLIHRLLARKRA